jgi:hypothetical protein
MMLHEAQQQQHEASPYAIRRSKRSGKGQYFTKIAIAALF